MSSITICIPTCKRPESLDSLLNSISNISFNKQTPDKLAICIADNDSQKSAEHVVEKWKGLLKWDIQYDVEKTPGIPFVRNKLVQMADKSDFIVFIDDDELATPMWLDELLNIQAKYDADVVMGPVVPQYKMKPPEWILKGGFHASSRFKDGITESNLITWNLLVRQNIFKTYNLAFEERMALNGGTDVLLGRLLKHEKIQFYWSDKAIVEEVIPPERCEIAWLLQRRFRAGCSEVLIRKYSKEKQYRVHSLVAAVRFFSIGFLKALSSIWDGKYAAVKGVGYGFQACGLIWGLLGFAYEEYKSIHEQ